MKNFKLTIALVGALTILLSSCGSSNNVVGNGILQKRKYNKGFHLAKKSNDRSKSKAEKQEVEYAEIKEVENTITYNENKTTETTVLADNQAVDNNEFKQEVKSSEENKVYVSKQKKRTPESKTTETKSSNLTNATVFESDSEEKSSELKNETKSEDTDSNSNSAVIALFLLIILAIIIPPIAVGLATGWDTKLTVISLILWILGLIPGIVFALYIVLTR